LKADYFTFTNLWHTRRILSHDQQSYDTASIRRPDVLPADKSLLIHFPEIMASSSARTTKLAIGDDGHLPDYLEPLQGG
jgi:hypothetical protein